MNERLKKVEKMLKQANKLGFDMNKLTEGKSLQTLARNKNTIANLEKRFRRQKERPSLLREIARREEKKKLDKERKQRINLITDESIATLKWGPKNIKESDISKTLLKKETEEVASDFMNRFFKQIRHEAKAQRKIKKLIKRFGVRLDRVYDLMEYVADYSFKYEIDREIMKEETPEDFVSLLYDRLDEFDRILHREYKI